VSAISVQRISRLWGATRAVDDVSFEGAGPLIVTNSVNSQPLTVGLQIFSSGDQGVEWSIITAATLMTSGPLLIAFLLFQRRFVQSYMRAGIR